MTGNDTQKARNIARDNRVSLTIDHDTSDPMAITGLSMAARAVPVTDEATIRDILFAELPKKYPEYASMMTGLDTSGVAVFELRPEVISFLDYSKGFAHTDEVTVGEADRAAAGACLRSSPFSAWTRSGKSAKVIACRKHPERTRPGLTEAGAGIWLVSFTHHLAEVRWRSATA